MNRQADKFFNDIKGKRVAFCGIGASNLPLIKMFADRGAIVTACDKRIEEQNRIIAQQDNLREQKDNLIEQKDNLLEQKTNLLEQKTNLLEQKEIALQATVKALKATGLPVEKIAMITGLEVVYINSL